MILAAILIAVVLLVLLISHLNHGEAISNLEADVVNMKNKLETQLQQRLK